MGDTSGGIIDKSNDEIDFSVDGAQSINLQNFLRSNTTFLCEPCNRTFATEKGLKIHRSYHEKMKSKIFVKKFQRKRKERQEESFILDDSGQCHMSINDLEEFLNLQALESNESDNGVTNELQDQINEINSNQVCTFCNFEAKTRAGLKIHMKRHNIPIDEVSVDLVEEISSEIPNEKGKTSKTRVHCPFSPSRSFVDKKRLETHLAKKHCDELLHLKSLENTTPTALAKKLMNYRNNFPTLRRIPKGARYSAADKFAKLVNECIEKNSVFAWSQLLTFAYISFNCKGNKEKSLTSKVKENIKNFSSEITPPMKKKALPLAKRVEAKVEDFDIKGAIRILSSSDKLAPFNEETFSKLKLKHPTASSIPNVESPPPPSCSLIVNEQQVRKKINSFQYGSGPGIDGFRPQFFKDIISKTAGEAGERALTAITRLANFIIAGEVRNDIKLIFFGASLCALWKKDNGIRPIAVGNAMRRLCGKLACSGVQDDAHAYLNPNQVGVATKLGGESVVHAIRKYVHDPLNRGKVILKIDFQNAFNSIDRSKMLEHIANNFPKIYQFLSSSYSTPSLLFFGKDTISSEVGCQQGDPCGPLSFSVTIQPIVNNVRSELNAWYLDDGTIADYYKTVLEDFKVIIKEAEALGLKINPDKCELFFVSDFDNDIVNEFNAVSPGIRITEKKDLEILGVPIFEEGYASAFEKKFDSLKLLISNLNEVNAHTAYCLLKNCLFIPKLTYMLRTSAIWKHESLMNEMDNYLKACLESIMNTTINDKQWIQASLPISKGGLGIRKISDICLPAFLSSMHGVRSLVSRILPNMDNEATPHLFNESLEHWNRINADKLPEFPSIQKQWDSIIVERIILECLNFETLEDNARFRALQEPESGGWLHLIPSTNIGTAMSNQDFQICVGLRLGINHFSRHKCICGSLVDGNCTHGLSCPKAKGTFPRHVEMNRIVHRALTSARHSSTLEPIGLSRDDGKRPDGVTLAPWSKGKRLVWDVTCVDTLAASYLNATSKKAGSAAERACKHKHDHYTQIKSSNFLFTGLAFETLGPWCNETKLFIDTVGKMLIEESGDIRAKNFLCNRISLAIQQGNATSILGTRPSDNKFEEIYNL